MKTDFDRAARILSELRLHAANPSSDKAIELAVALDQADGLHPRARCLLVELVRHFRRMDEVHGIMVDTFGITGDELGVGGDSAHPADDHGTLRQLGWGYHFLGVNFCVSRDDGALIHVPFSRDGKPLFDPYFYDNFLATAPTPDFAINQITRGISGSYRVDLGHLFRIGLIDATQRFRLTRSGDAYGKALVEFFDASTATTHALLFERLDIGRRFGLLVEFLEAELQNGNSDALASLDRFAPRRIAARLREFLQEPRFQSTAVKVAFSTNQPDPDMDEHVWWFLESEMRCRIESVVCDAVQRFLTRGPERVDGARVADVLSRLSDSENPQAAALMLPFDHDAAIAHLNSCLSSESLHCRRLAAATLVAAATLWPEAAQALNDSQQKAAHVARALMSDFEVVERDSFIEYLGELNSIYTWKELTAAVDPFDLRHDIEEIQQTIAPIWGLWRS